MVGGTNCICLWWCSPSRTIYKASIAPRFRTDRARYKNEFRLRATNDGPGGEKQLARKFANGIIVVLSPDVNSTQAFFI